VLGVSITHPCASLKRGITTPFDPPPSTLPVLSLLKGSGQVFFKNLFTAKHAKNVEKKLFLFY
tara:strand:- start:268 stop:456 length:189 start_codon:yes stop_codon:yes gene_type:complete